MIDGVLAINLIVVILIVLFIIFVIGVIFIFRNESKSYIEYINSLSKETNQRMEKLKSDTNKNKSKNRRY